jgi:hypothetical protein
LALRYVLICSPGGSGLKDAVEDRLKPFLTETNAVFCHQDVEDELCASYDVRKALQGLPVPIRPTVGDITRYLPRTQVIRFWKSALQQSLTSLLQCSDRYENRSLNLLTCHLDLYGGRRREMYSPIDVRLFIEDGHEVSHVLLLIDDIYDMYVRLSQPAALYDEAAGISEYVRDQGRPEAPEQRGDRRPEASRLQRAKWTIEWKANVLAVLLSWRRAEMLMAEAVAHQLNAKYIAFGVKQSVAAVTHWLLDPSRQGVYISHPISRPRRERRKTGLWPTDRVVEECNELQMELDTHGVTCVMPTAIDELRFATAPAGELPRLDTRWPIASKRADFSDTLYKTSGQAEPELTYVLLPSKQQSDSTNWRPWLGALQNQIKTEIAFRDHHLVAANPGLLVLRPFYGNGMTSEGVGAEVDHWQALAKDPNPAAGDRRAVFIHFAEDVEAMLREALRIDSSSLDFQINAATVAILEREGFSRHGMAQTLVRRLSNDAGFDSLLDAGLIPLDLQTKLRERWPSITESAAVRVLQELLTLIEMPPNRAGIWIVRSETELRNEYPTIAKFLRGELLKSPDDWITAALDALNNVRKDAPGSSPSQKP